MASDIVVDDRLKALEKDVADIKARLAATNAPSNWLERMAGTMKDEPDFADVLELGKAARQSDKPSPG